MSEPTPAHEHCARVTPEVTTGTRHGVVWGPRPPYLERRKWHPLCCLPREGRGTDRGKATPRPARPPGHTFVEGGTQPPPPPRLTRRRQAVPGARGCHRTPAEQAYTGGMSRRRRGVRAGGHRPPPQVREKGNHSAAPPPLSPHSPPPARGPQGRRPPTPPKAGGAPPLPPVGPQRPKRGHSRAEKRRASTPGPPAPTGTATGTRTRACAQRRHTDHARGRHVNTNRSSMGATPSMAGAMPMTPALLPAPGRQRDRPRQGAQAAPPPSPPAQAAQARPKGGAQPHAGQGGNGTPPPKTKKKQAKQGTGPRQDTRRGTDCVERPYRSPAPGPREVRAPRRPRGGARTPREGEHTNTQKTRGEYQKGNRTEPAERTDRMEWRTSERG